MRRYIFRLFGGEVESMIIDDNIELHWEGGMHTGNGFVVDVVADNAAEAELRAKEAWLAHS